MRRGYALWLASKMNTLIFVAAMFGAFVFYFTVQQDFQEADFAYRTAENVARLMDVAAASPGDFSQNFTLPAGVDKLAVQQSGQDYFVQVLKGKHSAQRSVHYAARVTNPPLQKPSTITISKSNGVVTIS